jgi:hypothetical protein
MGAAKDVTSTMTTVKCKRCQFGQLYVAAGEDDLMMRIDCPDCFGRGFYDPMLNDVPAHSRIFEPA